MYKSSQHTTDKEFKNMKKRYTIEVTQFFEIILLTNCKYAKFDR